MAAGRILLLVLLTAGRVEEPIVVSVPVSERGEVELSGLVGRLAEATGSNVPRPASEFRLPAAGLGGTLTRTLLAETLGRGVEIKSDPKVLSLAIPGERLAGERRAEWETALKALAARVERESKRRDFYGMYARCSYVPNDPSKPTVCLVHGMNSTSSVFIHMVGPIEAAGYGVVVYDFPYNRDVDETVVAFRKDWAEFRNKLGEKRPWIVLTHSMGAIPVRDYVEGPYYDGDVLSLVMIAPVNGGSYLAKAQTALQFLQGVQSLNGKTRSDPLAHLGDGLGAAAEDLTPGSPILRRLETNPRRPGLKYHILAGDKGLITPAVRAQVLTGLGVMARLSGPGLMGQLEELTDGTGDGAVAVARTRLKDVTDHNVMHANHLELIRAPMLFPDPGPVVSMPWVLERLKADAPVGAGKK